MLISRPPRKGLQCGRSPEVTAESLDDNCPLRAGLQPGDLLSLSGPALSRPPA